MQQMILPLIGLWLVVGFFAGETLIDSTLKLLEDTTIGDSEAAVLLLFAIAAIIALPWLLWRAIDELLSGSYRR